MTDRDAPAREATQVTSPVRGRSFRAALALTAITFVAGAFALGWFLRPAPRISAIQYGGERVFAINAHLASVKQPYVYLAGDSYMELYAPEPLPCGRDVVNGGVGGSKAGDYLRFLDLIQMPNPPATILLSVGLNNLLKKKNPGGASSLNAFKADSDALIARLGANGAKITVIAIPPVPQPSAKFFDTASIKTYTKVLADICQARGCAVREVFGSARDGEYWRAKPGAAADGLHLSNLRQYYREVYQDLCR